MQRLLAMTSAKTLRSELVNYDEDVLKEVYKYYVETDKKKTVREMIWEELRMRHQIKIQESEDSIVRFGRYPKWLDAWKAEWDSVRKEIRKSGCRAGAK